MSIICSKCHSTKVSCEAMINPNTKEFIHYTDESFDYGWCDNCKKGEVLTGTGRVKLKIQEEFKEYYAIHLKKPRYALCEVVFTSTGEVVEDMLFKLSSDVGDDDDEIFYYCDGIEELKSLTDQGVDDFIITGINKFFKS